MNLARRTLTFLLLTLVFGLSDASSYASVTLTDPQPAESPAPASPRPADTSPTTPGLEAQDSQPADDPGSLANIPPTVGKRIALDLGLGTLKARFAKTTLSSIAKTVGIGTVMSTRDAGGDVYSLCYTAQAGKVSERIWMTSDGEIGGRDHSLTGAILEAVGSSKPTKACPKLPKKFQPLSIDQKLSVPLDPHQLIGLLGKPSKAMGNSAIYYHVGKIEGGHKETGVLIFRLDAKNQVDCISASNVVTGD